MPRTQSNAIWHEKCPRCREGDIFMYPVSKISRFADMNEHCPVCNLRYEKEPGTFYGAMYVSYGFSIALIVTLFVGTFVLGRDPQLWVYFAVILPTLVVMTPLFFRYARVLWLYFFTGIRYDPKFGKPQE